MNMRVGLIGTGHWATAVHGASVVAHPGTDLIGVWGRDAAKTNAAAAQLGARAYTDVEALLADVDALTFAVPPDVQATIAPRAAERGVHLLLEKPIATSVADARTIEQAVTDAHVASIVFFTRRFVPEIQAWLQHLEARGGWQCGRAEFSAAIFVPGGPFAASPWRREKGALWDVGPHALSLLWPVLGEVESVVAGPGVGDQVHLVMQHTGGRSSTASLSLTVPQPATGTSIYVYGEAGREGPPDVAWGAPRALIAHQSALDALVEQANRPGSGHPCDVHFGARVVEVLAAADQSLASGCRVQVERPAG